MERTDTRPQAAALPRWRGIAFSSSTSAIAAAFVLVTVYVALRTMDAPYAVILLWTAAAAALTVASLLGGLTVLAAIGPFTEALNDQGQITAVPLLLAGLGLGILLAPRPPLPSWLSQAGSIALAALLSVADVLLGGLVRESPLGRLVRAAIVSDSAV